MKRNDTKRPGHHSAPSILLRTAAMIAMLRPSIEWLPRELFVSRKTQLRHESSLNKPSCLRATLEFYAYVTICSHTAMAG
jgi:hypothetical protein